MIHCLPPEDAPAEGPTPLACAVVCGQPEVVRQLLEAQADPNEEFRRLGHPWPVAHMSMARKTGEAGEEEDPGTDKTS